jgi:hypothetical protein
MAIPEVLYEYVRENLDLFTIDRSGPITDPIGTLELPQINASLELRSKGHGYTCVIIHSSHGKAYITYEISPPTMFMGLRGKAVDFHYEYDIDILEDLITNIVIFGQ